MTHEIKPSGAGWICTCGVWGWSDEGVRKHLAVMKTGEELSAVEKAIERNYDLNRF